MPIKELYENVMKPALYEMVNLENAIKKSVATEHLASAIVEAIINVIYPNVISKEKIQKK